jgi:hypothetical protein
MAKADDYQLFYCTRLKPGVKYEAGKPALAFNIKFVILNSKQILNRLFSFFKISAGIQDLPF